MFNASHDDGVITEVKKKVRVWCEMEGTAEDRGDGNVMDVVDDDCKGEVLGDLSHRGRGSK